MSMIDEVDAAIAARPDESVDERDGAALALAREYAGLIDLYPTALDKLGPLLLACLESLGLTPRGRATIMGKNLPVTPTAKPKSAADRIRDEVAARRDKHNGNVGS